MSDHCVETVLGPVPAERLGVILPHEHFPSCRGVSEQDEPPPGYRLTVQQWQRQAVREAMACGVGTFVEVTPIGLMRMVPMMQRISRDTGLHVVASTGLYVQGRRPEWAARLPADKLAEVFIRELTEGIAPTGAKAWMIKVAAGADLSEEDRRVFRAAAIASARTGAAITTHSCNAVRAHFDFLVESGADPARLYIGHADLCGGPDELLHVARNNGHLIFTCWGIEHFISQDTLAGRVGGLVEAGFPQAVLMSIDYAITISDNRMDLISMEYECPRRTPAFLFRYALPKLREKGLDESVLRRFLTDNPRAMLIRPAPGSPPAAGAGADVTAQGAAHASRPVAPAGGLVIRAFSDSIAADAMHVVNASIAGWPYCRPLDEDLPAHWKTLGTLYQPEHMLLAVRDGRPRAFLHGQRDGAAQYILMLAMMPGAVDEAARLLERVAGDARAAGIAAISGPSWRSAPFYGGYVLGAEPYHPHWGTDGTGAFIRAGFLMAHRGVVLEAAPETITPAGDPPKGYEVIEPAVAQEFQARTFRLAAACGGKQVALCNARLYPRLLAPGGGPVGQLGYVATDEPHRNRGLATLLVRLALQRLKEWGASRMLIATGLENFPALRAYEKAGFRRRFGIVEWSKTLRPT